MKLRITVRRAFDGVRVTMQPHAGTARVSVQLSRTEAIALAVELAQATVPARYDLAIQAGECDGELAAELAGDEGEN